MVEGVRDSRRAVFPRRGLLDGWDMVKCEVRLAGTEKEGRPNSTPFTWALLGPDSVVAVGPSVPARECSFPLL